MITTFSTRKLLAVVALLFALNLPRLSLQCELDEVDCSFGKEFRCCGGNSQCAIGTGSSGCCGTIQGQSAFCCENNSTCMCAYAPAQQCCGAPGEGFVCGSDNHCCGSVLAGNARCCGPNQFCDVNNECVNQPIPTDESMCQPNETLCNGGIVGNPNTLCCESGQSCVQGAGTFQNQTECCDTRLISANESAECCYNNIVGCICTYTPTQKCCGLGNGDGFVCLANDTCCGTLAEGTNKCCPFGTICNLDGTCESLATNATGTGSSTTTDDPVQSQEDVEASAGMSAGLNGMELLLILGVLALITLKDN